MAKEKNKVEPLLCVRCKGTKVTRVSETRAFNDTEYSVLTTYHCEECLAVFSVNTDIKPRSGNEQVEPF